MYVIDKKLCLSHFFRTPSLSWPPTLTEEPRDKHSTQPMSPLICLVLTMSTVFLYIICALTCRRNKHLIQIFDFFCVELTT